MLCYYLMRYHVDRSFAHSLLFRDSTDGKWSDQKYIHAKHGTFLELFSCAIALHTVKKVVDIPNRPGQSVQRWKWQKSVLLFGAMTITTGIVAGKLIYRSLHKQAFPLAVYQQSMSSNILKGSTDTEKEQHAEQLTSNHDLPAMIQAKVSINMATLKLSQVDQLKSCFEQEGVALLPLAVIEIVKAYMSEYILEESEGTTLMCASGVLLSLRNPKKPLSPYEYLARIRALRFHRPEEEAAAHGEVSDIIHNRINNFTNSERVMYLKLSPNNFHQNALLEKWLQGCKENKQWMELLDIITCVSSTGKELPDHVDEGYLNSLVTDTKVPSHLVSTCLKRLDDALGCFLEILEDPHTDESDRQTITQIRKGQIIERILKNFFKSIFLLPEFSQDRISICIPELGCLRTVGIIRHILMQFTQKHIKSDADNHLVNLQLLAQKLLSLLDTEVKRAEFLKLQILDCDN